MQDIKRRSKHFIDRAVQGALLFRAARYWVLSLSMVAGLTVLGWLFVWPGVPTVVSDWGQLAPLAEVLAVGFVVTVLMLPVVLYDLSKLSNRFVGPIYRLRRSLNDLADGKPVQPIKFRDGDYWQDVADAFNRVLEKHNAAIDSPVDDDGRHAEPQEQAEHESLMPV